mmetsp:Transcript_4070/g.5996  ORF Transcript_4070/g.5996 Transcript_4070/m.5996 type:complete len:271 (+) Transcript_4070:55-867(+)
MATTDYNGAHRAGRETKSINLQNLDVGQPVDYYSNRNKEWFQGTVKRVDYENKTVYVHLVGTESIKMATLEKIRLPERDPGPDPQPDCKSDTKSNTESNAYSYIFEVKDRIEYYSERNNDWYPGSVVAVKDDKYDIRLFSGKLRYNIAAKRLRPDPNAPVESNASVESDPPILYRVFMGMMLIIACFILIIVLKLFAEKIEPHQDTCQNMKISETTWAIWSWCGFVDLVVLIKKTADVFITQHVLGHLVMVVLTGLFGYIFGGDFVRQKK